MNLRENKNEKIFSRSRCLRSERHAVFVDLDDTLFPYTEVRTRTTKKALTKMHLEDFNVRISDVFKDYQTIIKGWQIFEKIGFQNFRQNWNSPKLFSLLLALVDMRTKNERLVRKYYEFKENMEKVVKRNNQVKKREMPNYEKIRIIREEIDDFIRSRVAIDFSRLIHDLVYQVESDISKCQRINLAVDEFERDLAQSRALCEEARSFVKHLSDAYGIELYLVSEGNSTIQLEKLKISGLTEVFKKERVIITDEVSIPSETVERVRELSDYSNNNISHVLDVIESMSSKFDENFYARIIQAVQVCPEDPRGYLIEALKGNWNTEFKQVPKLSHLKLAAIGDRYDSDARPLIELLGDRVFTLRIISGKYKREYPIETIEKEFIPAAIVSNLAEARDILIQESTWRNTKALTNLVSIDKEGQTALDSWHQMISILKKSHELEFKSI